MFRPPNGNAKGFATGASRSKLRPAQHHPWGWSLLHRRSANAFPPRGSNLSAAGRRPGERNGGAAGTEASTPRVVWILWLSAVVFSLGPTIDDKWMQDTWMQMIIKNTSWKTYQSHQNIPTLPSWRKGRFGTPNLGMVKRLTMASGQNLALSEFAIFCYKILL